jgi:hypothetical protein
MVTDAIKALAKRVNILSGKWIILQRVRGWGVGGEGGFGWFGTRSKASLDNPIET